MKKFFITLLILIIAGGVVFYFGWVQIQVPAEGYAVIFSKTHGYDEKVIKPGDFTWRWQRLIPTNVKLHVFEPEIHETTVSVNGTLPSGALYAKYLKGAPDFSWEIEVYLRSTLRPEELPSLLREEHISEDNISDYFDSVSKKVKGTITPRVRDYLGGSGPTRNALADFTDLEETLRGALSNSFPAVDFMEVHISSVDVPDFDLYRKGKDHYLEMVEVENRIRREETERAAAEDVTKNRDLTILKEYGKILSDYPILMDYLELKGSFSELSASEVSKAE